MANFFTDLFSSIAPQNAYQAQQAPTTQFNYAPGMNTALGNALQGYGGFQQNQQQQQQLAQALQGVAQGQGPNPAQAMLNQATGQNVANQQAMMAGQRGAGANAGLMARQAAMQGGNLQQQAVGQGATMQAQQSLGAMGQQAGLLGQMGQQGIQEQQANTGLFGTAGGLQNAQNQANIQNMMGMQGINAGVAQQNTGLAGQVMGGFMQGAGAGLGTLAGIPKHDGGVIPDHVPDHLHHVYKIYHCDSGEPEVSHKWEGGYAESGGKIDGQAKVKGDSLKNDVVPVLASPGEIVLPRSITMADDAPAKAAAFVEAEIRKKGHGSEKHHSDFKSALKEAIMSRGKKK